MLLRRKRMEALENEVATLRQALEDLRASLSEKAEKEKTEKATLAQTLNEWVYGKESGDGE